MRPVLLVLVLLLAVLGRECILPPAFAFRLRITWFLFQRRKRLVRFQPSITATRLPNMSCFITNGTIAMEVMLTPFCAVSFR